MSVVERIKERQKSNRESLNILRSQLTIENIPLIKLTDFAKLDCAIQVYSEVLGSDIWLCANERMVSEVKEDLPNALCYTAGELIHIVSLNPKPEKLKRIHNAKEVFVDSKIVDSRLGNEESKGKADN